MILCICWKLGQIALDVAQASNHQAVCEILEQHVAYQTTRTELTDSKVTVPIITKLNIGNNSFA